MPGLFKTEAKAATRLMEISTDKIAPNPNQPRTVFDDEGIAELARSIQEVGLIQPLIVRYAGEGFELVAGERRLRACKTLGMQKVPCVVQGDVEEEASAIMALIENLQREDLNFFEEARCYEALINNYNMTQEELAKRIGKSQSAVANKLRVLRFDTPVQQAVLEAGLTERHARALLKLKDAESQLSAVKKITEKNLSVKQTEQYVDKTLDKLYDSGAAGAKPRPHIVRLVKDYRLFMNTINAAVNQLRESGMKVEVEQNDIEDGVDIRICVRK